MPRGRKRKSTARNKKPAKIAKEEPLVVHTEVGEDGFGIDDHFSRLPTLCHLAVFKHLKRIDIHNASMANKTLRPLAFDYSLDTAKFGGDGEYLILKQTLQGYGFDFRVECEKYPWPPSEGRYSNWFHYEIVKADSGAYIERKTVNKPEHESTPSVNGPHDWVVPDEYFDALANLGQHLTIAKIDLKKIPFNAISFSKLKSALKHQKINMFRNVEEVGEKSVSNESRKSFLQFIREVESVELRGFANLLNEDFVTEVGSTGLCHYLYGLVDPDIAYAHRFYPKESILPHIVGFRKLDAASMVLDVNWIAKLCMMKMASIKHPSHDNGRYRIAIDQPISSSDIIRALQTEVYECSIQNRTGQDFIDSTHYITRRRDSLSAKIEYSKYSVTGSATMHVLNITFFEKRKRY